MAFQGDTQGQIQDFLTILRKRVPQVLLICGFITTVGVCAAVLIPKKYVVSERVELRPTRIATDPILKNPQAGAVNQEVSNTEYHLKHHSRVRRVLEDLDWVDYAQLATSTDQAEYINMVLRNLKVAVLEKARNEGSTFVDITYADVDAQRAVAFLRRLTKVWIEDVVDRDRVLIEEELNEIQNERAAIERLHKEKFEERRKLQRDLQIPSSPVGTPWAVDDPVFTELSRIKSEVEKVSESLAASTAQLDALKGQVKDIPATRPVAVPQAPNTVSQQMMQLQMQITQLRLLKDKYKPAHSLFKKTELQIQQLQEQLESLNVNSPQQQAQVTHEPNPARGLLLERVAALEAQNQSDRKLLEVLEAKEREFAQRHEERLELFKRLDELDVELQSMRDQRLEIDGLYNMKLAAYNTLTRKSGVPFEIVDDPIIPPKPEVPNPYLIIAFSFVAGLALGLATAFIGEFSRNCFRSVNDVSRVMAAPVLGVVNTIVTRRERRKQRLRRAVIATSSLMIMGGMAWLTWAFTERQDLLGTDLVQTIEDVRMKFR